MLQPSLAARGPRGRPSASPTGSGSPCSARTGPASPPCCRSWPAFCARTAAGPSSTARSSSTSIRPARPVAGAVRPRGGPARAGRRCCSRTSACSTTSRSGPRSAGQSTVGPRQHRPELAGHRSEPSTSPTGDRRSCPADRRSASRSPGPSPPNPHLLLLDEPLAALDVGAAPLLRRVLRQVLADRSAIIVTHDLLDALLLADRVIVLDDGTDRRVRPHRRRHPTSRGPRSPPASPAST